MFLREVSGELGTRENNLQQGQEGPGALLNRQSGFPIRLRGQKRYLGARGAVREEGDNYLEVRSQGGGKEAVPQMPHSHPGG